MNTLLIDHGSRFTPALAGWIKGNRFLSGSVVIQPYKKSMPKINFDDYGLIVLSGAPRLSVVESKNHYAWYKSFFSAVPVPVFGVCLGMQLIAHYHGATLQKKKKYRRGVRPLIFQNEVYPVYESHRWAVTKLSCCLDGLAESKSGFEAVRVCGKPIAGVQFHPEVTSENEGWLVARRILLDICSVPACQRP